MNIRLKKQSKQFVYLGFLISALVVGLLPAALAFKVDPYEMFRSSNRGKAAADKVEKAHYPLWKFTHYSGTADLLVLGDSRARALRNKYWHEWGALNAYNFAYGGGTIPEIYSTFQKVKDDPNLRTLVIGIQLRSFDENHRGGMNRVPEAVKVTAHSTNYLKNWFVIKKSWEVFKLDHPRIASAMTGMVPDLISKAEATDLGTPGTTAVETLLLPDVCFGCDLPDGGKILRASKSKGPNFGLGRGLSGRDNLHENESSSRQLTGVFKKQVERNAKSDWKAFRFSENYFAMLETIASWADEDSRRKVIFVIPPTIVEMQKTISAYGLSAIDQRMRHRLSKLAPVIDLDFPNAVTSDLKNFSDAYHFGPDIARNIVGQIVKLSDENLTPKMRKRAARGKIVCPPLATRLQNSRNVRSKRRQIFEGPACRIWGRI